LSACALITLTVWAPAAAGARSRAAAARTAFHPRIGRAMGLIPPHGHEQDVTIGTAVPVVYHGGTVMRGVTLHTVFWAPSGYRFSGSPGPGVPSYEQLQQQFFADVAHDSGLTTNSFSVMTQYPDGGGGGQYKVSYNPASDSIDATDPYPPPGQRCVSPSGIAVCITDAELQQELDHVIQTHAPTARGLHDIWFVFLPPDVDTCVSPGACGTNAFAGYHSLSNLGHGPVVYANIPDPLIEFTPPGGSDPQGNPEAEATIDTTAHETVEAITDPVGVGWMDPNGFEVGDKCENGSQPGTPLGFAANGSPYNQLINGRQYFFQTMWSNTVSGCVQSSTSTQSALPLASVNLTQFSPTVTGNIAKPVSRIPVLVEIFRAGAVVAVGAGRTDARGNWRVRLIAADGRPRAPGDDRDQIAVRYGKGGPAPDLIETGNGGNPFTESGWTGWYALDSGYAVSRNSIQLGPCGQTGVLAVLVDHAATAPPIEQCSNTTDAATVATKSLRAGTALSMSSADNRAVSLPNPAGAAIRLSIQLGEPGAVPSLGNSQNQFATSGFPTCIADLQAQAVRCSGLVARTRYTLTRGRRRISRRARADASGLAKFTGFPGSPGIRGGDVLALRNSAGRLLTRLHVAHLRVDLQTAQTIVSSGRCEPGDYYGPPLGDAPVSPAIGVPGVSGSGTICPPSGRAKGLPINPISQVDDLSGGQTRTQVPLITGTAPIQDATLYGRFIALAQTGLPGPNRSTLRARARVSLTITRTGARRPVFRAANVAGRGVVVRRLRLGSYHAKWVLSNANGDTRTLRTAFVVASS
jgi:hypothetical protein